MPYRWQKTFWGGIITTECGNTDLTRKTRMPRINSYHSRLFVDSYYIFMDSELRQDLVSGDWIVVAPGRISRPRELIKDHKKRIRPPVAGCPFENPQKNGNEEPILIYPERKNWRAQIVSNKYPVVSHGLVCARPSRSGPYTVMEGVGHHEILITRGHDDNFGRLKQKDALLVFRMFGERYRALASDKCLSYISIFHNWGPNAGASVYHPHYQIMAIPVIPPDVEHSLEGSAHYFKQHKKCVHCVMLQWEKKEKKRVVYENKDVIVFAPFVSREPFELRIFPKRHLPYFENTATPYLESIVDALQKSLKLLEKRLNDPDYNFFIHTAPLKNKNQYKHYHWHIEILPKISVSAGFELGTGIEITVVDPDEAAGILKGKS